VACTAVAAHEGLQQAFVSALHLLTAAHAKLVLAAKKRLVLLRLLGVPKSPKFLEKAWATVSATAR